jgi:hypothetical protein
VERKGKEREKKEGFNQVIFFLDGSSASLWSNEAAAGYFAASGTGLPT